MYSNNIICNILEYISININTKITIEDLEHHFFYNRYYIMKLFKKEMGVTILNYINKLRIYNSIKELNSTNNLLIRVAINNGFYSLEYFSETFKKEVGMSPRKYRKAVMNRYYYNDYVMKKINNNIIMINILIEKADKYMHNQKPIITPVRKLSIFE